MVEGRGNEWEARVHHSHSCRVQKVFGAEVKLGQLDLPGVLVEGVDPVELRTFKEISVGSTEPDLGGCVGLVPHLSVDTEDFLVDQPMLFHLGQDAVVVRILETLAQAKTHVAVTIGREEGCSPVDGEDLQVKQADGRKWAVLNARWELVEGALDLSVEGVQLVEVSDLVDLSGDVFGAKDAWWSPLLRRDASAVLALGCNDCNFIQHRVWDQLVQQIRVAEFEGQHVIEVI